MSCILHIETATEPCSVAVSQDGMVIYHDERMEEHSQASVLGSMVEQAISFTDSHGIPFDAVAVSGGPGSYTGLRIGVSMAKGVCYAQQLKLVNVPTLQLLCVPLLLGIGLGKASTNDDELPEGALLCPMIDARRMEVYAAVYDRALNEIRKTAAVVVDSHTFDDLLDEHPVYFFGRGAEKFTDIITHPNAHIISGIRPLAKYMAPLAEKASAQGRFEDVAYFEPFYLKEFAATKRKKDILHS